MKRRIVVAGKGDSGTATSAPRLAPCSLAGSVIPVTHSPQPWEPAGVIWDGWHRDVTLCQESVTPGWGTRFGDAPEGLDLV